MGQRLPPSRRPTKGEPQEYVDDGCSRSSPPSKAMRLVERFADALGVSPTELYDLPSSGAADDLGGECAALLDTYRRIQDPAERRRLLLLVQKAAEQT